MIAMTLEQKLTGSIIPLLYTWTEPVLSLKSIFPTLNHSPELVGDMHNQVQATRVGCVSVAILLQLLIKKVISILVKNCKAVKVLDLTGFPVLRSSVEELFQAKFNVREKLTIVMDLWIPEHGTGDSNWIQLLNGTKNFSVKIQNVYCCSLREPVRNRVLSSALKTNPDVRGVKLSCLKFVDWPEVKRTLSSIQTCSKLSMLDLSRNNMFDSSPNDEAGRSWVNKFLKNFPHLSRLDLSFNLLRDRVGQVLQGLSLTYLNLTASHLVSSDLQSLVNLKSLVHLDLSQNNLGDSFSDLLSQTNMLVNLEILELEDCFFSPTNFAFVFSFIQSCPSLKILNLSYNTFNIQQILQLIQLQLEVLLVFSKMVCDCLASQCDCYEEGQLRVTDSLSQAGAGYQLKSFDKQSACTAIQTVSKFIVFKAFMNSK